MQPNLKVVSVGLCKLDSSVWRLALTLTVASDIAVGGFQRDRDLILELLDCPVPIQQERFVANITALDSKTKAVTCSSDAFKYHIKASDSKQCR